MIKISPAASIAASVLAIGIVCYGCFYFQPEQSPSYADEFVPLDGPPGAARRGHSLIDTGSSVILWGGNEGSLDSAFENGFIYSYQSDVWNTIDTADIEPRSDHISVWTGNEMIVWGGFLEKIHEGSEDRLSSNGFAFSPHVDSWRSISDAPLGLSNSEAMYSEGYVVIAGGLSAAGSNEDLFLYDLEKDSWRSIFNDFVVHRLHGLPSGDVVLTGIDHHRKIRIAILSIDDLDISEITIPGLADLEIYSYGSSVNDGGELLLVTSGERVLAHRINVGEQSHQTYRMQGGPVHGLTDPTRSSLSDGEMWPTDKGLIISVSGSGVSFLDAKNGRITSFSSGEIGGHCGTGLESVMTMDGLLGIGGTECNDHHVGFLLPTDFR